MGVRWRVPATTQINAFGMRLFSVIYIKVLFNDLFAEYDELFKDALT